MREQVSKEQASIYTQVKYLYLGLYSYIALCVRYTASVYKYSVFHQAPNF